MSVMNTVFEIILLFLAVLILLLTRFALLRLRQPTTPFVWMIKVFISALSPFLFLTVLSIALIGVIINSLPVVIISGLSAILYLTHITRIIRKPATVFEKELSDYENLAPRERRHYFLTKRYVLRLPNSPDPILMQNIPFHKIPGSNRQLLCDVWRPPNDVGNSGLAFIYLHGSAWTHLDKDFGTRTFFRHLAAQGHVIIDVAYRLFPETDFMGMVHDIKHAIAWTKATSEKFGVDPSRIVIGGGSAGAHLALLAAYTNKNDQLTPADLKNIDLRIRGVISLYGQSDLTATYYHTCQHLDSLSKKKAPDKKNVVGMPSWIRKRMGKDFHRLGFNKNVEPGMLVPMLGGDPKEKPELYSLYSPISYVNSDCPSTLFLHGEHDCLAPLDAIQLLQAQLNEAGVPTAIHVIAQTDHAFDLVLPKISPSAHNAIYDVERFLAMCAYGNITQVAKSKELSTRV